VTDRWRRRLGQIAAGLALAAVTILVTEWAFPAGHLAITIGRPYYSRSVGETSMYVTIDIAIKNVGADSVQIDREHFLLVDSTGRRYQSDPSTHFLANHFDVLTMPPGYAVRGATVFQIEPGHEAAALVFVSPTGEIVRFRLL